MKIFFGAMADPLSKQLGKNNEVLKHCQKDADAITRLLIRNLISDSTGAIARKKLVKKYICKGG